MDFQQQLDRARKYLPQGDGYGNSLINCFAVLKAGEDNSLWYSCRESFWGVYKRGEAIKNIMFFCSPRPLQSLVIFIKRVEEILGLKPEFAAEIEQSVLQTKNKEPFFVINLGAFWGNNFAIQIFTILLRAWSNFEKEDCSKTDLSKLSIDDILEIIPFAGFQKQMNPLIKYFLEGHIHCNIHWGQFSSAYGIRVVFGEDSRMSFVATMEQRLGFHLSKEDTGIGIDAQHLYYLTWYGGKTPENYSAYDKYKFADFEEFKKAALSFDIGPEK